jgi:hypothetical protein
MIKKLISYLSIAITSEHSNTRSKYTSTSIPIQIYVNTTNLINLCLAFLDRRRKHTCEFRSLLSAHFHGFNQNN